MREDLGVTRALSALGVILSLVFVGFEVRQNTMATRGATMQAMSDAQSGLMANLALDEGLVELIARVFEDSTREDFTTAEYIQLNILMQAYVRQLENTYIQHREGLVSDVVFETFGWQDPIYATPFFAEWWDNLATRWLSTDFRAYFESRVQIGP